MMLSIVEGASEKSKHCFVNFEIKWKILLKGIGTWTNYEDMRGRESREFGTGGETRAERRVVLLAV